MITRRLFLRNTAAAGASLSAVSAPIIADAAQQEDPTLLQIRDQMPAAVQNHRRASVALGEAVAQFGRIAPPLPVELICTDRNDHWMTEREIDCLHRDVWPERVPGQSIVPRRIYSSHQIERQVRFQALPKRSLYRQHYERLHKTATEYEVAWEQARVNAGL